MKLKKYAALFVAFFVAQLAIAQNQNTPENDFPPVAKKIKYKIVVGYNIGGTAPIGLPNNIRKIKSYSPLFSPSLGYEGTYQFNKKWAVNVGLKIDLKGMSASDSVAYYHTLIQQGNNAAFEGSFSGNNYTKIQNTYLTLPILAQYSLNNYWHIKLGCYLAYLLSPKFEGTVSNGYIRKGGPLGEKVTITATNFDFSNKLRHFDFGLDVGAAHDISHRWTVAARIQWGLVPVFPSSFTGIGFNMYNIYGNLGIGYKL